MITAFMSANELHVVHVIHQKSMTKIRARGVCGAEDDAGIGVYQVPDWAFDGRPKYVESPICGKCSHITNLMKSPPK